VREGLYYNKYFPGHQIAMPPPLFEDAVEYPDGTPATVEQMAEDVTHFLAWAAEPTLEARHRTGVKVILFLLALTALAYAVKRKVWADIH
jgi:cytochrome c1